jgi:hypothetical protein
MVKSNHPLAGKEVDCDGTPPECGHNHHTTYSNAWGLTWVPPEVLEEYLSGEEFEDHVKRLLDGQQG